MAILNYTTSIKSEKTIMEIQQILSKHGAMKIVVDYEDGLAVGVTFGIMYKNQPVAFSLPAKYNGVLNAMKKDKKVPKRFCNEEQAIRVSWRIVKDWVEAQMALVQADLADVCEVFLPYAVTNQGKTLYETMETGELKLLQ